MFKKIINLFLWNFVFVAPVQSDEYSDTLISNQNYLSPPSLHILITTIGRDTLLQMLDSLHGQMTPNDYLTVVFDGVDICGVFNMTINLVESFCCHSTVIMEKVNLGFWGHGIRNKYNILSGDFILHGDDDDIYTEGALSAIREICIDRSALYIFKMRYTDGRELWVNQDIIFNQIGTPMGVIPSFYNSLAEWGCFYGGDFAFYNSLKQVIPKIEFVNFVIYHIRPSM